MTQCQLVSPRSKLVLNKISTDGFSRVTLSANGSIDGNCFGKVAASRTEIALDRASHRNNLEDVREEPARTTLASRCKSFLQERFGFCASPKLHERMTRENL